MPEIVVPEVDHAALAAYHLSQLPPGRLPYGLFLQTSRLTTNVTAEIVALRQMHRRSGLEALLVQRPPHDDFWPNAQTIPGSNIVATDTFRNYHDYDDALGRLLKDEDEIGGGLRVVDGPHEFGTQTRKSPRGTEVGIVHWALVVGEPVIGQFFDIEVIRTKPPAGILDEHRASILEVVDYVTANGSY